MRRLKEIEKKFNKLANKYGKKAYTAYEFDKNSKLQKALSSFEYEESFQLENDLSNIFDMPDLHHEFLDDGKSLISETFIENDYTENTAALFSIHDKTIASKIACIEYYETYAQGFVQIRDKNGEYIQDTSIQDKISKFHSFCLNLNYAKKFIKNHFPRWEHADEKEKRKLIEELKKLEKDLSPFCANLKVIKIAYMLISKYGRLNKDKEFKTNVLLYLQLPNIETKSIAKKIVESLISKYQ